MQPKVPDDVKADLAAMGLTTWLILHPITFDYEWTGNGPKRGRADKTKVQVQLQGPGLDGYSPWGHGPTARAAIADALRHPVLLKRQGGLTGAMAGLEEELRLLRDAMWKNMGDALDVDVPF